MTADGLSAQAAAAPQRAIASGTWIAAIVSVYVGVACVYAWATPIFEKPDEDRHVAFATHLATQGFRLPDLNAPPPDYRAAQEGAQPPLFYFVYAALLEIGGLDLTPEDMDYLARQNPQLGTVSPVYPDNLNVFVGGRCLTDSCTDLRRAVYIGRGLNILFGALSLMAAGWTLIRVFSQAPLVAPTAVALIAFTPQFLHITSGANNDALVVFGVNLTFAAIFWRRERPDLPLRSVALGAAVGLSALSKTSGLSAAVIAGIALTFADPGPWRRRLTDILIVGAAGALICGWWYGRNLVLYGDPTATNIHLALYQLSSPPLTLARFFDEWVGVFDSFYGAFGWGAVRLSAGAYSVARVVALALTLLGGVVIWRQRHAWTASQRLFGALALAQFILICARAFPLDAFDPGAARPVGFSGPIADHGVIGCWS